MAKNLYQKIMEVYPELTDDDFHPVIGTIGLQDDSDGQGVFISKWNYSKEIPEGLKLGK
jgi:hypothetical protein